MRPVPDLTRAQVAAELDVSERTLRRYLPRIPDLECNRIGRKVTFSKTDVAKIREAMRCRYITAGAGKSGTRGGASGSGRKRSSSPSSPQERVRALTQKQLGARAKRKSAVISLTERRGGNAASQ
jgi:hypothetical protein